MAESKNVYVKIGERGTFLERTANREIDHANLRATGWVLKGSKNAPSAKDAWAEAGPTEGLSDTVPTSHRAAAQAADADEVGGKKTSTTSGRGSSSAAGAAGAAADAKSQSAAGR